MAVFADARSVEKVACIDLNARLGRQHLEHTSRVRLFEPRRELGFPGRAGIERKVVIVSAAEDYLRIAAVAHAVADETSAAEIKNSAGHGSQISGGDQRGIDRSVAARRNGQPMSEYVLRRAFARQVEDCVIRDVHYGRCVRGGIVVDRQGARFVERCMWPGPEVFRGSLGRPRDW